MKKRMPVEDKTGRKKKMAMAELKGVKAGNRGSNPCCPAIITNNKIREIQNRGRIRK